MRDLGFWVFAAILFASVDYGAFRLYGHLVDRGVIRPIGGSVPFHLEPPGGASASQDLASRFMPPSSGQSRGKNMLERVPLAPGQRCVEGTVIDQARQADGSMGFLQPLESGKPIACEGVFRSSR